MTATLSAPSELMAPGNTLGNLRQRLYTTLAPILPGRVYAYPPAQPAGQVAPAVWVGGHSGSRSQPSHLVTFSVWAVADGAAHAAQAMLDELVAAAAAAVYGRGPFVLDSWSATTVEVAPEVELAGVVFDVTAALGPVTFCPPIPYEALVPPEVVPPEGP